MDNATISIEVDADTARAYRSASVEEQRKLQLLLRLWMKDLSKTPALSLRGVMNEMSDRAEARGLTPEILDSLLKDA
jgi:hypothetical protein